jgi:hypothetical protein
MSFLIHIDIFFRVVLHGCNDACRPRLTACCSSRRRFPFPGGGDGRESYPENVVADGVVASPEFHYKL